MDNLNYYIARSFIEPQDVVIDYGCGRGDGTKILSVFAKKVIGVDKDRSFIKEADKKNKSENGYFMVENVDQAPDLPQCDVSVAINLLKLLRFPDSFLGKLKMSTRKFIIITGAVMFEDNDWKLFGEIFVEDQSLLIFKKI